MVHLMNYFIKQLIVFRLIFFVLFESYCAQFKFENLHALLKYSFLSTLSLQVSFKASNEDINIEAHSKKTQYERFLKTSSKAFLSLT